MRALMFWSYKGGSGRTVAAANVAAALAKRGRRVAILDLDFEAPGLHYVLQAEGQEQFKAGKGVQHYLRGEIDATELCEDIAINVFKGPLRTYAVSVPPEALLLYIMASPKVAPVDAQSPQLERRLRALLQMLEARHAVEWLIIDAANGIRDAFSLAAAVSDEMLMFFRWSTQHVEGTLSAVRHFRLLKEYDQRWIPYMLIASAVPTEEELKTLVDPDLRGKLIDAKELTRARIEHALTDAGAVPATIFHEIPEMVQMKWREQVDVFSGTSTAYDELAEKLVARAG
jgi:MinD-like ATPase involved in chromosome partitioning or flagellar assembly